MEFSIKAGALEKLKSPVLALAVLEGKTLAQTVPNSAALDAVLQLGDLPAEKTGATLLLHKVAGFAADRILLVNLGRAAELDERKYREAVLAALKAVAAVGVTEASVALTDILPAGRDAAWAAEEIAIAAFDAAYRFDRLKSKTEDKPKLAKLTLVAAKGSEKALDVAVAQGAAIGQAISHAKDLGNLPPNICTPTYLAETAQRWAKENGMKAEVLDRAEIEKLGMGSFVSVGKGSAEPMKLIVLRHEGGAAGAKPVVLVGKGITFDSGGISLKPGEGMDEMKFDMMGAGSVLATMYAISRLKLPLNVIAVVATCENMPAGHAYKPGDVLTTMAGITVEVLNTDAEGRLILCDALTYAERFEPAAVIDVATLTGACVIALGHHATGLYANQQALADQLLAASVESGDRAWQMPLWDEYQESLKSNFADLANVGGRPGGSITAACFLSRFAKKYDWAHLDIAGTAWKSGAAKGASGRPVPLLTRYLRQRAAEAANQAASKPVAATAEAPLKKASKPAAKTKPEAAPKAKPAAPKAEAVETKAVPKTKTTSKAKAKAAAPKADAKTPKTGKKK
ncbi:leucyl aminopeptidase [Chitinimonas lacunae]|uniref:Probable cytosol aminopeptidase n=1 Tax=Chitinimonas lacunae TaxID=1963018 RepID=A0ABV8MTT0_9NEIS